MYRQCLATSQLGMSASLPSHMLSVLGVLDGIIAYFASCAEVLNGVQSDLDERKVAMKLAKLVEGRRMQAELVWQSDQGGSDL